MVLDLITFVIAFLLALALYPPAIRALRRMKAGQVIQQELPDSHQKKAGTPTGGGVLFVALAIVGGLLATVAGHAHALASVAGLAAGGVIGLADDRSKLMVGARGIPARLKFPVQLLLAVPVAVAALYEGGGHQLWLSSSWWLLLPLSVIAIVGTANAKVFDERPRGRLRERPWWRMSDGLE